MAGKKTFVAGEVLLAQDVNDYLMDQSVMVFGGTAARSSAIPTPSEGMFAVTTNDDELDYYNGSAWVPALPIGAWTAYTPAFQNLTVGNGISSFFYAQLGKTVHVRGRFILGSTSSVGTSVNIAMPVTISSTYGFLQTIGHASYFGSGSNGGSLNLIDTTNVRLFIWGSAGGSINLVDSSATSPFTWANTDQIIINATYEAN